jgi:hypothetical protein
MQYENMKALFFPLYKFSKTTNCNLNNKRSIIIDITSIAISVFPQLLVYIIVKYY